MFGVGVGTETVPDEWDEPQPESLAARLSDMPTRTELGVALSEFDREELDGFDRVLLLEARARQVAHLQAEMLADIESIARADDQPFGHREWSEFVADEIGAALHLTRRSAENWWWLASRLTRDLPQVWQAPSAGDLDLPRARVFASELEAAPDDLATRIADQVLEWASSHTTGQIASRIRRLMIAADPALAASRYEKGQGERMLLLSANPDGTANLEGYPSPPIAPPGPSISSTPSPNRRRPQARSAPSTNSGPTCSSISWKEPLVRAKPDLREPSTFVSISPRWPDLTSTRERSRGGVQWWRT